MPKDKQDPRYFRKGGDFYYGTDTVSFKLNRPGTIPTQLDMEKLLQAFSVVKRCDLKDANFSRMDDIILMEIPLTEEKPELMFGDQQLLIGSGWTKISEDRWFYRI